MLEMFHDFKIFFKTESTKLSSKHNSKRNIFQHKSSQEAYSNVLASLQRNCMKHRQAKKQSKKKKPKETKRLHHFFFFSVQPRLNAELKTKLTSGKQKANLVNRNKPKNNTNTVT